MTSRPLALLLLLGLLAAFGGAAQAADTDPVQAAERTLREARQPTDGPGLLDYLRRRTLSDADRAHIQELIKQLADDEFAVREKATDDLLAIGIGATPLLRLALKDPDIEVVRRAERCLKRIEESAGLKTSEAHAWATISMAIVRLIGSRKPAGAPEVLLAFLPFADDEAVADEVRASLAAVAVHEGKPDKALTAALEDRQGAKRAAAVQALIRSCTPAQRKTYQKYLHDPDLLVRHQAALAFFDAKDKEGVPVLIALMADLPVDQGGWGIEDMLCRLAGEKAPAVSLGKDEGERKRCRDAWQEWWLKNGDKIDLSKINLAERLLGYTLVVELNQGITGRVKEVGLDGKPRWQIEGLQYPVDAQVVGDDRVLVAEYRSRTVSERNFKGEVIWQKMATTFVQGLQRLPNGNTLIVTRNQILEVDGEGKDVSAYTRPTLDIMAAQRRRDGHTILLTMTGQCIQMDTNNQEVKSFAAGTTYVLGSNVEILGNGRILVPQYANNKVVEFDGDGKVVWEATVMNPNSVFRLANGNTVVASNATGRVVELDRSGKEIWDYKGEGRLMRARRR